MDKKIFLLLVLTFFFSSCETLNMLGAKSSGGKVTKGYGLEVTTNFLRDATTDTNEIKYFVSLKNSGQNLITLKKKDLKIFTHRTCDGKDVLNEKTVKNLKNKIFGKQSQQITLPSQIEIKNIQDSLTVNQNCLVEDLILEFQLGYNYRTDFSSTVNINLEERVLQRLDKNLQIKNSPIKFQKIELAKQNSQPVVRIYLAHNFRNLKEEYLNFDKMDLTLGKEKLNCKYKTRENSQENFREIENNNRILSKNSREIMQECVIKNFKSGQTVSTTLRGIYEYEHKINKIHKIEFNK